MSSLSSRLFPTGIKLLSWNVWFENYHFRKRSLGISNLMQQGATSRSVCVQYDRSLKSLTLNIVLYFGTLRSTIFLSFKIFFRFFLIEDADVICLQEVTPAFCNILKDEEWLSEYETSDTAWTGDTGTLITFIISNYS